MEATERIRAIAQKFKPTLLKLAGLNQQFNEEMTAAISGKPAPSVPSARR